MRRLTRLETGFLAAAVADKRRLTEKYHPERLRPGYDGETLLFGSAMIDQTQALVHLARYDGHLSRRFFRAVKQLADLRRDERKAREARSSVGSYTTADSYSDRYVPAQAPPPIGTPSPPANHIGFRTGRASAPQPVPQGGREPAPQAPLTQTTKQTQSRRTPVKSTPAKDATRSRFSLKASDSFVAHTLSVPRRDSSRRLGAVQTTKQTQSRRTPVESTPSKNETRTTLSLTASDSFVAPALSVPPTFPLDV